MVSYITVVDHGELYKPVVAEYGHHHIVEILLDHGELYKC